MNDGMYSSATSEWPTPQAFFDMLNAEFDFTLDPCATHQNAKCDRYYTTNEDGLSRPWSGIVWMNPPYGSEIGRWIRKAYLESRTGATVVALVPARTDTRWWHEYVMLAAEIRFIRGRLNFEGVAEKGHNAPFPNAIVVFRPGDYALAVTSMDREPAHQYQQIALNGEAA